MKPFQGFPARMNFTPVPNLFLNKLVPEIDDITELKVSLHIMEMLYQRKGYPRFVTMTELLDNPAVAKSLAGGKGKVETILRNALDKAVQRETFLHLVTEQDGKTGDVYFLNTPSDRQALARIKSGQIELPGLGTPAETPATSEEPPNIFALYEDNIGLLTPMIAEELKEAEKLYPAGWIEDAIKEAVSQGVRKWSYIAAILESWLAEGKKDGTHKPDTEKDEGEKYDRQRYGHMVQR
jgi:DnaD/phage-associated family protein